MRWRRLSMTALLALALLAGGCWDHQPPENTAFILMMGIDKDPHQPEQHVVTQLAVLPQGLAAGESNNLPEGTPFYLLSNSARTLETAQLAVTDHLSRLPRLDHLQIVVLGEDLARQGAAIEPAVAWALRHPQIRPGIYLFVAEGSAQSFLDARPALDPLPGAALIGLVRHASRVAFMHPIRMYEFAQALLSPRKDAALPIVRRINPLSVQVPEGFKQQPFVGQGSGQNAEPMDTQIQLVGMAIFKGEQMIGTMMRDDGLGYTWIEGDSKAGLSIRHPEHPESFVFATAISSSAKRRAKLEPGDKVTLSIEISASMDVWGEGIMEPQGIGRHMRAVEDELAETIKKQVVRTMNHLQQLEADVFGFAEELYRTAPRDWDKVSDRWDALYAQADVLADVKVSVRRTGLSR